MKLARLRRDRVHDTRNYVRTHTHTYGRSAREDVYVGRRSGGQSQLMICYVVVRLFIYLGTFVMPTHIRTGWSISSVGCKNIDGHTFHLRVDI